LRTDVAQFPIAGAQRRLALKKTLGCKARKVALALPVLTTLVLPCAAQEAASSPQAKWRPEDGIYAAPGKDFLASCSEYDDIVIDLRDRSVSGNEWSCKITSVVNEAPDAIKIEMTCDDYNLAQYINPRDPKPEERRFKEILLLKRIDAGTIVVHKSSNGKFKYPAWTASYCPKETQRSYAKAKTEGKQKAKEESKQKAEQEQALRNAHPRDGVYSAAGADFEDRCAKFDDTIVAFAGKSIATASNICKIENTRVQLPDTVRIDAACTLQAASGPETVSVQDPNTIQDRENLMFKKIDDKTVILWIINNGHFTGDGRTLSYCSDKVQRAYVGQRRTSKQNKN
jgi:hypothetical protein